MGHNQCALDEEHEKNLGPQIPPGSVLGLGLVTRNRHWLRTIDCGYVYYSMQHDGHPHLRTPHPVHARMPLLRRQQTGATGRPLSALTPLFHAPGIHKRDKRHARMPLLRLARPRRPLRAFTPLLHTPRSGRPAWGSLPPAPCPGPWCLPLWCLPRSLVAPLGLEALEAGAALVLRLRLRVSVLS